MPDAEPESERILVEIDLNELTWGDLEQIERLAGHSVSRDLANLQDARASALRALVAWKHLQEDPNFDPGSMRGKRIRDASFRLKEVRPPDPTSDGSLVSKPSSAVSTDGPQETPES